MSVSFNVIEYWSVCSGICTILGCCFLVVPHFTYFAVIILLVPISNGTAFNWLFAGEAQLIEIQ